MSRNFLGSKSAATIHGYRVVKLTLAALCIRMRLCRKFSIIQEIRASRLARIFSAEFDLGGTLPQFFKFLTAPFCTFQRRRPAFAPIIFYGYKQQRQAAEKCKQ